MTWVVVMVPAPWYAIEEPIPCSRCGFPGYLYWQGDCWLCFLCGGSSSEAVGHVSAAEDDEDILVKVIRAKLRGRA